MSEKQLLHTSQIRTDGGTQMRAELDPATIEEYAQAIQAGATFPPIVVYYDGETYWLGDGFHRLAAYKKIFMGGINCEVRSGTRRDAVLCAAGANATHGRRRTNADKRRSVETLLRDEEWQLWSNAEIARRCAVDEKTVRSVRSELTSSSEIPKIDQRSVQRNGQTYTMQTTNIAAANQQRQSVAPALATQPTTTYQSTVAEPTEVAAGKEITETLDAAVRRATCVYTGDHERWQGLVATGADYWQILELLKSIISTTSGASMHGGYTIECRRGPIVTIRKGVDGPVVANLMSGGLVTAVRRAWAIPEIKSETPSLVPTENISIAPVPDADAIRLLTSTETEAVIWRAIQHSGHTIPADQLAWLQNSTGGDFRKLLNPGVNFADAIFLDAFNKVQAELRRQSTPITAPAPAQSNSVSTNTAIELVWAALNVETFPSPILPAKIKFLKTAPFAIFKSFLAKGETVTDETMLAALGKVEASLTLQMETCEHRRIGPDNHCNICGQPASIPSPTDQPSQPPPAEPVEAEPAAEPTEEKPDGDEYYTPPYIIEAARQVLGDIDLDPASSALAQTVVNAKRYYTKEDDGLTKPWTGTVWHNPPYSRPAPFVAKLIAEYEAGNITAAILLVNTGTETQWGQSLLTRYPVCFVGAHGERRSRISFWRDDPTQPDNRNRYSQMIFYLGDQPDRFVAVFQQFGAILEVKRC